jgi:hypothetical protein
VIPRWLRDIRVGDILTRGEKRGLVIDLNPYGLLNTTMNLVCDVLVDGRVITWYIHDTQLVPRELEAITKCPANRGCNA